MGQGSCFHDFFSRHFLLRRHYFYCPFRRRRCFGVCAETALAAQVSPRPGQTEIGDPALQQWRRSEKINEQLCLLSKAARWK